MAWEIFRKKKTFIGTYADTEMQLVQWLRDNPDCMLLGATYEKGVLKHDFRLKNTAARKVGAKTILYCHDNSLTRALGFRPGPAALMYQ